MEVYLGMKRSNIVKLRDEIDKELAKASDGPIEVTLYGDTMPGGHVLRISNDDMEREDVHDNGIFVEVDND